MRIDDLTKPELEKSTGDVQVLEDEVASIECIVRDVMCRLKDEVQNKIISTEDIRNYVITGLSFSQIDAMLPQDTNRNSTEVFTKDNEVFLQVIVHKSAEVLLSQEWQEIATAKFNSEFETRLIDTLITKGYSLKSSRVSTINLTSTDNSLAKKNERRKAMKDFFDVLVDTTVTFTEDSHAEWLSAYAYELIRLNSDRIPFHRYHMDGKHRLLAAYFAVWYTRETQVDKRA